jgi:hypothetical protein
MDTTARRSRRSRRRSASPTSPTRVERDKQYYLRMIEEFCAEEERRSRLTLKERMAEDGREIQRRLEREPTITILLQPSPPRHMRRAQCLAGECPIADTSPRDKGRIIDDYRIVFVSDDREYFHISCLEKMIRLPSLAPSRFKLDKEGYRWNNGWPWTWGLMLRKWFKHSRCIDLAKIAEYIDRYNTLQRANSDFSTQHVEWQLTHLHECTADRGSCGCLPEPEGLIEPTLEDYKTEKECSIGEVLRHPYVERLASKILVQGLFYLSILVVLEQESRGMEQENK